jgi:hypothetical protein
MPMFYFSLTGRMTIADADGENLPTLVDAMQEAIGMAWDLTQNKRASEIFGDQVVVTNESGQEVFRMPLLARRPLL